MTDVTSSSERIERYGEGALHLHRSYLEAVYEHYRSYLAEPAGPHGRAESFWFPGDAMWGVFLRHEGLSAAESVTRSTWHFVFATACGLARAFRESKAHPDVPPLEMRGVLLAGQVHQPDEHDLVKVHGGTALNACGRLEKQVSGNGLRLGYVFEAGDETHGLFEPVAGSPRLGAAGLRSYLADLFRTRAPKLSMPGCRIEVDTVVDGEERLLRFRGRSGPRGLENCQLLTTQVRLVPNNDHGLEVVADDAARARWSREHVELGRQQDAYDLHEIVSDRRAGAFSFMKEVYGRGQVVFKLPQRSDAGLLVESEAPSFRPRLEDGSAARSIDLARNPCFLFPTNKHRSSGRRGVLVQSRQSADRHVLRLSQVDVKRDLGGPWAGFLDSGRPALEVGLCKGQQYGQSSL